MKRFGNNVIGIMMVFLLTRAARSFSIASQRAISSSRGSEIINLHTIRKEELEDIVTTWGYPKYRAGQVYSWVRKGVTDVNDMNNIPQKLREHLSQFSRTGALELDLEVTSKDGTRKRAYRLWDGQLIESVLMPYEDGRYTACISSQAGCAMGCVFCATGQMGFARQLTPEEIFEQVSRFASELAAEGSRLSNVVFMGMGEPLANYRNVLNAVDRINADLGIGARKITISTVGLVPNIRKLMHDLPQVRLAVSLHCADEEERTELMPANGRYGGLDSLMPALREYIMETNRRITLEWALIEGQNDTPETARQLGSLIKQYDLRRDMVHVNVIPLNPTGGFAGSPSGRGRVQKFVEVLGKEFGIACTPRVRRGIDINAGCGQLKASIEKKEEQAAAWGKASDELASFTPISPNVGLVYEDDDDDVNDISVKEEEEDTTKNKEKIVEFYVDEEAEDLDDDDWEDTHWTGGESENELQRLIGLVQSTAEQERMQALQEMKYTTTSIVDEDAVREAKKRRKKLLKNLKAISKLREMQNNGKMLNDEQLAKIAREEEWKAELESVEHNLQ